jgi:hypothetical protein
MDTQIQFHSRQAPCNPGEAPEITQARAQAQQARCAYDAAASDYAARVARVAALLIRAAMPTAALLVFARDEEVATADTTIDIVTVLDAAGESLGELDDPEYQRQIEEQLCIAYDATDGAGPFDIGPEDDDPQYQWGPRSLLQLDIDTLLS